MSEIENRPVQNILREAVAKIEDGFYSGSAWDQLCQALHIRQDDADPYGVNAKKALTFIADRIDQQGVVEVTVPGLHDGPEWPRDKAGAPCRFGDEVEVCDAPGRTLRGKVHAINGAGDVLVMVNGFEVWASAGESVRHFTPRSLVDVISDTEDALCDDDSERVMELMREAYELGKEAADE